jgi:hypothetical protein
MTLHAETHVNGVFARKSGHESMLCKSYLPGNPVCRREKDEPRGIPSVPHGGRHRPVTPAGDICITG